MGENMKCLLVGVNAKYIHSNPGLYSMKAYATKYVKEYAKCIEIAEYTVNHRMEEILSDLYLRKPDVIGFSCYIWNSSLIQELIHEIAKLLPGIPIYVGGPEVSFDAGMRIQSLKEVTGIIIGEGEETWKELLDYYVGGKGELCAIAGIHFRDGSYTQRALLDFKNLPFMYESLDGFKNRILYYESQRGCPFRCSYCLSSVDKTVRYRDLDYVQKDLDFFLENKVKQVKFVDRTFNMNANHALTIWTYICEHDNGITNFHFEIAADLINDDQLAVLGKMRPGLVQLEVGVQTTNQETLKAICRNNNLSKLKQVVSRILDQGNVHLHLDLIAGLPKEDLISFANSFEEVYQMKPHQLQLGFLKVLKGAPIASQVEEFGIVYLSKPPFEVLKTRDLSYDDVLILKKIEDVVENFYNSNQFSLSIKYLERYFESAFEMYHALADFLELNQYYQCSSSRVKRYELLLEFFRSLKNEEFEEFRQILTLDFYAREKAKSRPEFACDLEPYKEEIRNFYEKEIQTPNLLKGYQARDSKQLARMTHLEIIRQENGHNRHVLFDYQKINPISGNARMVDV